MMSGYRIPVYEPSLGQEERAAVLKCLDTNWISSKGEFIGEFERGFASYTGAAAAATVSNGTVALHLCLLALGIGPGDEVIVPTLTYVASANAIMYVGATPVFVDSDDETWQMSLEDVRGAITPRTRAIMAVHLYGQACDMDALSELAREHRLLLIEDCAEAIGTRWNGKHVGTFGDIASFSFYGNKTITTGEGGMVVSQSLSLDERVRHLRGQGLAQFREYWHDVVGYNYRMTNICAAIGVAQLGKVESILARKKAIDELYRAELGSQVTFQKLMPECVHSRWMTCFVLKQDRGRDDVRRKLTELGIETRPVFYPVHLMPMYSHLYRRLTVAESLGRRGINLPSHPGLSDEQVLDVCRAVRDAIGVCLG